MRLGRPAPLPRLVHPARGIALIAAGALVLVTVQGWGAVLFGFGMLAYGVGTLLTPHPAQNAAQPPSASGPGRHIRRERITVERRTRERIWTPPAA